MIDTHTLSGITYDLNGNIETLIRLGTDDTNSTPDAWDILTYTYQGNQLMRVEDASAHATYKHFGFDNGNVGTDDYSYDKNGNMTVDANKDITGITYNHLNLPEEVTLANGIQTIGTIEYIYDALGVKLRKRVIDNQNTTITDYAGGFIYQNGDLQFFTHPEGYVEKKPASGGGIEKSKNLGGPAPTEFSYVFQYVDHLGNVRLSYSDSDENGTIATSEIIEESNYYPFGLKQKGYNNNVLGGNSVAQQWKYNGTELNEDFDVNWYEMEVRQYDPAIARWTGIDPVTHFRFSTYSAFDNNPVYWADPSGADATGMIPLSYQNFIETGDASGVGFGGYTASGAPLGGGSNPRKTDDTGIATKYDKSKTVIVESHLVLYGGEATEELAGAIQNEISQQYNSAGSLENGVPATIMVEGEEYTVLFRISVEVVSEKEAIKMANSNKSALVNFIRVEKTNDIGRSYMSALGSNSGFWQLDDKLGTSSTAPHEYGHGFYLDHDDPDQRGAGNPSIMAARGTLVDSEYQWNPKARPGDYGGTVKPVYRQVLQQNINMIFRNVTFDSNGKANLGKIDNIIYGKKGNKIN